MKNEARSATSVDIFVGRRLKALRKADRLTQSDVAKRVGITFQQIQKYERGTNRIGASRLWLFCKIFNVKPNHFFDGIEAHLQEIEHCGLGV